GETEAADPLAAEETRVLYAQALHARAAALDAEARARNAEARLAAARRALTVTPSDIEGAKAQVAAAERALAEARDAWRAAQAKLQGQHPTATAAPGTKVAEAGEALVRAKRALAEARLGLAEAKARLAHTRLAALQFLARPERRTLPPPELALAPKTSRRLTLQEQAAAIEAQMGRVREALAEARGSRPWLAKVLEEQLEVLRETLDLIRQTDRVVADALYISEIVQARYGEVKAGRERWVNWLLTLIAALLTLALIVAAQRGVHRLLGPEGGLSSALRLDPRTAAKMDVVLTLSVFFLLGGGGAWAIARFVWEAHLSPSEVWDALDQPLFLVEDQAVSFLSIVKLFLAIVVAVVLSRFARRFLSARVWPALSWDSGLTNALNTLVHYSMLVAGFLLGLRFVGIGLSSLALFAGVLGIGIGFGLRNIAENFISGLIILAERPIKIGDFIEIDGRMEGKVTSINARATTIVTRDNISVIVPNSQFIGGRVTNWSHGDPKVRLSILVGVAYGSNTDLVRRTLLDVAERHGKVLRRPPPEVHFIDFGSSSLDFRLLVWIDDQDARFRIASDLRFAIDKAFRKAGIEIAFPQLDLHFRSVAPEAARVWHHPPPGDGGAGEGAPKDGPHEPAREKKLPG
ncbi:MAG: hypothetical protein D6729_02975, partial [Deltaproteobacteria bacterium]